MKLTTLAQLTTAGALAVSGLIIAAIPNTAAEEPIRTVEFGRSGPCSTCGAATPVTITCAGLTWAITQPGTIAHAAAPTPTTNQESRHQVRGS